MDTCRCGAQFKTESGFKISDSNRHQYWLDAHKVCRAFPEDTQPVQLPSHLLSGISWWQMNKEDFARLREIFQPLEKKGKPDDPLKA
jgi:hypothetical protein